MDFHSDNPVRNRLSSIDEEAPSDLSPRPRAASADSALRLQKLFLVRLVVALHSSGNLTFRTEKLVARVGRRLGLQVTSTILPGRVIMTYMPVASALDPSCSESYTFHCPGGLHIQKLMMLEQLCFDLAAKSKGQHKDQAFSDALRSLDTIEKVPSRLLSVPATAVCFFLASMFSSFLWFGGNAADSAWSGVFGACVFGVELLSQRLTGLSEINSFTSSFIISLFASLLDLHVYKGDLCLLAAMYGGVVWLLPGLTITLALLEIYSSMMVYGASRLIYGISQASQLGFGLALGRLLVVEDASQVPQSFVSGCRHPVADAWGVLFLPLAASMFAMMINAAWDQVPGMVLSCAVGQTGSYLMSKRGVSPTIVPFVCAMLVTTTSRLYAWWHGNERPLVYIIAGLLVLVPGGVGVKGVLNTALNGDSGAAMNTVSGMCLIGIMLAVGVFVSLVPTTRWLYPLHDRRSRHARNAPGLTHGLVTPNMSWILHTLSHGMSSMKSHEAIDADEGGTGTGTSTEAGTSAGADMHFVFEGGASEGALLDDEAGPTVTNPLHVHSLRAHSRIHSHRADAMYGDAAATPYAPSTATATATAAATDSAPRKGPLKTTTKPGGGLTAWLAPTAGSFALGSFAVSRRPFAGTAGAHSTHSTHSAHSAYSAYSAHRPAGNGMLVRSLSSASDGSEVSSESKGPSPRSRTESILDAW